MALELSFTMADVPSTPETPVVAESTAPAAVASKPKNENAKKAGKDTSGSSKRGKNPAKGIIEVEPVIGTRDFYPEDMRLRTWLFDNFRAVAKSFCFQVRLANF